MIDAINKALREPAVSTTIGGHKRGGATLTRVGTQLVGLYRAIEVRTQAVAVPEREALRSGSPGRAWMLTNYCS
jgi:molybdate transport system regulatory protein